MKDIAHAGLIGRTALLAMASGAVVGCADTPLVPFSTDIPPLSVLVGYSKSTPDALLESMLHFVEEDLAARGK